MRKNLINILLAIVAYILLFAAVCFMWVGAEYIFEKFVDFGIIDSIFAAYAAYTFLAKLIDIRKKIGESNDDPRDIQV